MPSLPLRSLRCSLAAVLAGLISGFFLSTPAQAADLAYNAAANPGWFAAGAWSGDSTTWVSGSSAVIDTSSNITVILADSTDVANLTLGGSGSLVLTGTNSPRVLQMSGGNLSVTNLAGGVLIGPKAVIQGNYTFDTNGWLRLNNSASQAYVGTATVQAGKIHYTFPANQIGSDSNFIITGGEVLMERTSADMGSLTLNTGSFLLGRLGTADSTLTISTTRLQGDDPTAKIQTVGNSAEPSIHTLVVNQSGNTTYAGQILGTPAAVENTNRLVFQKDGVGDLTLTGQLDLRRGTTVSGGRLYINSNETDFQDEAGPTGILVNGGSLGGTGTIHITGGDHITLGTGGGLTAGLAGVAGTTTIQLDGGNLDLSQATAGTNTGWLHFDLGGSTKPGTDYDQIRILGGSLNIGSGLNFSDFDFAALPNFKAGSYVLFQTPGPIAGSLGTAAGAIKGLKATLSISGNNLVLTVGGQP
jgi:hypothetical protein